MYSLLIKPRAILMTQDAYGWYEFQTPGLGENLLAELDPLYARIEKHPFQYDKVEKNFRQAGLKKFPFVVVFEIIKKEVVVYAVFHTSRNPKQKFTR